MLNNNENSLSELFEAEKASAAIDFAGWLSNNTEQYHLNEWMYNGAIHTSEQLFAIFLTEYKKTGGGMSYKKGEFAEGLRQLNTKGALVLPIRLNKRAGRMLMQIVNHSKDQVAVNFPEEGTQQEDDFHTALQFIVNEVSKRWSLSELYRD